MEDGSWFLFCLALLPANELLQFDMGFSSGVASLCNSKYKFFGEVVCLSAEWLLFPLSDSCMQIPVFFLRSE